MKTIYADYNAATEAGHYCLTTIGARADIERLGAQSGDWAWLSDSEVVVGAQLAIDDYYGLVGIPDWDTLVHLDDDDVRDLETVRAELQRLLQGAGPSRDEEGRMLQLLMAYETLSPPEDKSGHPPGFFASRRAETLMRLGKPELALLELDEARRLGSIDPDDDRHLLGVLRQIDLPRARREAEALASRPGVPAGVLAECVNILATCADDLPDDQFEPAADQLLSWTERFDSAPGREVVLALTLALLQFNRGMTLLRLGRKDAAREALRLARAVDLLRLGRKDAAREALRLARAVDPIFPGIDEATGLTAYNPDARDLAARVRSRPTAA